jgi:hypothetical protein
VVFGVCLELLNGTLNLGVGNPNGISLWDFLHSSLGCAQFLVCRLGFVRGIAEPFLLAYLLTAFPD